MDQQGYIKNRNICFNIRQIQDIIDYADLFEIDGVILFLDFKKARAFFYDKNTAAKLVLEIVL